MFFSHLELFSARLPVKVFKTLNGRQSYILSKFRSPLSGKERIILDIISIHQRKVKITLYTKAFLFHHNVDKMMLKCISAPEAADPTIKRVKTFPAGFPRRPFERSRCYDVKRRLSRHALDRK